MSIILNVIKPNYRVNEEWPKVSFFAVYDGHGGSKCADFLKENLHHYIFREECFPHECKKAITRGFEQAEKDFLSSVKPYKNFVDFDRSGSCAIVIILLDDICYCANLGDSRAVYSEDSGKKIYDLSKDHKPNDLHEKRRIEKAGGYIYQGDWTVRCDTIDESEAKKIAHGPHRVFPGKLSVSRAFGDIEAKIPDLGGNPYVLIAKPDIVSFKITNKSDFIIFGCFILIR